jgi:hypothetical protein
MDDLQHSLVEDTEHPMVSSKLQHRLRLLICHGRAFVPFRRARDRTQKPGKG